MVWDSLEKVDPEVSDLLKSEIERQNNTINLIASENYTSLAVLSACSSVLTNKYAEGYPEARYYGGCSIADKIERLAIERAKSLFKAEYANVQCHSGTQANMAVYFATLKPYDKILAMDLESGGHLSHGAKVNFSGFLFSPFYYGVEDDGFIDYDKVYNLAKKITPKLIVCGASAYPRKIDFEAFSNIAKEVGAFLLADIAHTAGIIAANLIPSPVGIADFVTATTHKTLRGPRGGFILCKKEFSEEIDKSVFPGIQGGPLMHVIAAKAVCFQEASTQSFVEYQRAVLNNAQVLAEELLARGFNLVSSGTDTHLILIDLRNLGISGKEAEERLAEVNIIVNKNAVPNDPLPKNITSGIRLGTPSITTQGFGEAEVKEVAKLISSTLKKEESIDKLKERVKELCSSHPVYLNLPSLMEKIKVIE